MQLLAQILQHLSIDERMEEAAVVCSAWKTAAIMATDDIYLSYCPPSKCSKLSAWLQANSSLAPVSKLCVCRAEDPDYVDDEQEVPLLQLPVLQLRCLRELQLCDVHVAPSSSGSTADAVFSPALAAVTILCVYSCTMSLQGLEHLTGLQSLSYTQYAQGDDQHKPALLALGQTLPRVQHLTELQFTGAASCDAVLLNLGSCTQLVQLRVRSACCSAEGLQQLPTSLQQLQLDWCSNNVPPGPETAVTLSNAPRLLQLTALQDLSISGSAAFDTALLDGLAAVTRLALWAERFTASPGQYRFQALAQQKLPCLQELLLSAKQADEWLADECAALIAAAQHSLTWLQLQEGMLTLTEESYSAMFPAGANAPQLRALRVGVNMLDCPAAVAGLVRCCRQLTSLEFARKEDTGDGHGGVESDELIISLHTLRGLHSLQSVAICDQNLELTREDYQALAALTRVSSMQLRLRQNYTVDFLLELVNCHALKHLLVTYWESAGNGVMYQHQHISVQEVSIGTLAHLAVVGSR